MRRLMLILIAATAAASPAHADNYSDVWGHFAVLVWQYRTPPPGQTAERAYDSLNLSGIHLDDGFPRDLYLFARSRDFEYYVDHAAGKGDLHLRSRDWGAFMDAYRKDRRAPRRPNSLNDPAVRERMLNRLRENIPRALDGLCLAYAFDDEISTTSFTAPADVDWAPVAMAAFRGWLARRYGTVDALNRQWETRFKSFSDALPATVDDVRRFHSEPFSRWNLSQWADHREFMDDTLAETLTFLRDEANRLDPDRPAGFVGGQAPSTYGGYDYAKLARAVQFIEAYDIGATDSILRSFWGSRKPRVQTFFSTGTRHVDRWFLWNALVRGNRGVIAWPELNAASWFDGERAVPEIAALAPTFEQVQGLVSERFIGADYADPDVGLYYSQPSIRVSWMMDIQPHGSTWINRSSSLNNANASDLLNRVAWSKWLEDCGIGYEFVSYLDVQEGVADLSRYRAIILPRTFALSEAETDALRRYVEGGGLLIADYGTGIFDEHGKGQSRGSLDLLFGIARGSGGAVLDGDSIAEINAEKYQLPLRDRASYANARREGDFVLYERILRGLSGTRVGGRSVGADFTIENETGAGRSVYLNLTPIPYLWLRREAAGEGYRVLLQSSLASVGIRPYATVLRDGQPDPLIARVQWRKDGATYLCLVANPLRDAQIDGMGTLDGVPTSDSEEIEVVLADPASDVTDERTNRNLGAGSRFRLIWNPHEAAILRITAP